MGNKDLVLDEKLFVRFLVRERARADRSQKSFLLMLFQVDGWLPENDGGELLRELIAGLGDCLRETDFIGWYRQGMFLGTVFTELDGACGEKTQEAIRNRVLASLSSQMGSGQIERLPVSLHLYPEEAGPMETARRPDRQLYPDLEPKKFTLRVKRWMDIAGSLLLLAASAPIFLLVAPLIAWTSPGPVFYRQRRLGQFGRPFSMLKFRTMKVDADPGPHKEYFENFIRDSRVQHEEPLEQVFKLTNDPRVTWMGRWLRRTSLDEIPQFLNVLRGEMSLEEHGLFHSVDFPDSSESSY